MNKVRASCDRAQARCRELIVEEVLAVAIAFEAAHPDVQIAEDAG
jgi:hypothetical protein